MQSLSTIFAGLILITFLVSGCEQKSVKIAPSGTKIKVGIIVPLSGMQHNKGKEGMVGIKTAMKLHPLLNNGDKIELVIENGQNDPEHSVAALKRLSQEDKVTAILLFSGTESTLAITRVANQYKTPILSIIATNPDVIKDNAWVSQFSYDDNFQGTVAALYVRDELLFDKVAVVSNPESPYSTYLASVFIREFVAVGGKITDNISISKDIKNYNKHLTAIKKNQPDLIYLPINAEIVLRISQTISEFSWQPVRMGSDGLLSNVQTRQTRDLSLLNGMLVSDLYSDNIPLTAVGERAARAFKTLGHEYKANTYSTSGFEAFSLLINAMNRCNNPADRPCVNAMIRSTNNFTGVIGKISIDKNGKAQRPLIINRIHNGKLKFVVKVN